MTVGSGGSSQWAFAAVESTQLRGGTPNGPAEMIRDLNARAANRSHSNIADA
jgi:hypothetical protein